MLCSARGLGTFPGTLFFIMQTYTWWFLSMGARPLWTILGWAHILASHTLTNHSQTQASSPTWGARPTQNPHLLVWGPATLTRLGGRLGVENCATMRSWSIVSSFQLPPDPPGKGRGHHLSHLLPAWPESQAGGSMPWCPFQPEKQRNTHKKTCHKHPTAHSPG